MIRFFAALIASVALLCSQTSAGFLLNSYSVVPGIPTLAFQQCATTNGTLSSTSTYTFTGVNVGTASGDRKTIVGIAAEDATSVYTVSSVTVGGDAATISVDYGGAARIANAALAILDNPSGTSEDVVVVMSEAITNISVCIWSVTGTLSSNTAVATNSGGGAGSSTITLNANVSANGIAVGVCGDSNNAGSTYTWTGMTERADAAVSSAMTVSAGDYTAGASAETPRSISAAKSSGGDHACAAATYR